MISKTYKTLVYIIYEYQGKWRDRVRNLETSDRILSTNDMYSTMSDHHECKGIQSITHSFSHIWNSKSELEERDYEVGSKGLTLFNKCWLSRRNTICAAMVESIALDCLLITRAKRDHTRPEGAEVSGMERNRRARRARRGNSGSSAFHNVWLWLWGVPCQERDSMTEPVCQFPLHIPLLLDFLLLFHLHVAIHVNSSRPTVNMRRTRAIV